MADEELDEEDLDEEEVEEGEEGEGEDDEEEGAGLTRKQRILIIIGSVLLLFLGGLAAAYFTGLLQPLVDMLAGNEQVQEEDSGGPLVSQQAVFYDLPEMLVNLDAGGRKSTFLKIRVSLELENGKDIAVLESVMPRVIDNFQVYLRELRIEDLKGSAGMYRLREEMLKRVTYAAAPAVIKDVLFKEMLIQ